MMTQRVIVSLSCLVAACASPEDPPTGMPGEVALEITSPAPGAELGGAEHSAIRVTGTASTTHAAGQLEVWVNGVRAEVTADGAFTADLPPAIGINHIAVEASDGTALVERRLDVMWAPAYLAPLDGSTGFDVASGLELRLGQRFFDTRLFGTDLDLGGEPVVARDLASALELILWHVDLAGLLDGGIQFGEGDTMISVAIPSAAPQGIVVDARVVDDPVHAIDLTIDLSGVFLEMDGAFHFSGSTMQIDGGIAADLHASARLVLEHAPDGSIAVTATAVTAEVGPLAPMFVGPDGDELNALITLGESDFRALVQGLLAEELIPTFTDRLPPLLETLLGALDDVLGDTSFTLETGLGRAVTLELDGRVAALDVVAGPAISATPGHVTVRQDLAIRTTGTPLHPGSLGAAQVDPDPVRPSGIESGASLAMRIDLLNTLLHALWNDGLLEGDAMFGGVSANVSARLAPVVRANPPSSSCTIDGERCDLILQLGQLEVTLGDFEQSFAVNATAGARIVIDGDQVSVVLATVPSLIVWETSSERGVLTPAAVSDLIADLVWPELVEAIGENLTITLPLPDLSELGLDEVAPGLANAELQLVLRERPTVAAGYIGLGANLELATPSPSRR